MTKKKCGFIVFALIYFFSGLAWADEKPLTRFGPEYIIGPGDKLDIHVWKDEAMSRVVIVRPDGEISFPLIGQVAAGGKTIAALKKELETKINRFVPAPELYIDVFEMNSMKVYVIGKVNRPGHFLLDSNINVLQALAMAGGLNSFAKKNDIRIFRKEENKTRIIPFRYGDVSEGENLEMNIPLEAGDVIVVP